MKYTKVLATLLAALSLVMSGCGTSDSIKSLLLTSTNSSNTGVYNLAGQDSTLQLKAYAIYNSGKQIDVTNKVTWTVTPTGVTDTGAVLPPYGPLTVPINNTGLMTGIVGICTWTDLIVTSGTTTGPANPPQWAYTGYYQTSASYRGFTSQPVAIGVGVTVSNNSPAGGCGPA